MRINPRDVFTGLEASFIAEIQGLCEAAQLSDNPNDMLAWCSPKALARKYTMVGLITPKNKLRYCLVLDDNPKDLRAITRATQSSSVGTLFFKHTAPDAFQLLRLGNLTHSTDAKTSADFVQALIGHFKERFGKQPVVPPPDPLTFNALSPSLAGDVGSYLEKARGKFGTHIS